MSLREQMVIEFDRQEKETDGHYQVMYDLMNEYYEIKKKCRRNYSIASIANELRFRESYVYSIMAWRHATEDIKESVRRGKISRARAHRIMRRCPKEQHKKIINYCIENNVTDKQLDELMRKEYLDSDLKKLHSKINTLQTSSRIITRINSTQKYISTMLSSDENLEYFLVYQKLKDFKQYIDNKMTYVAKKMEESDVYKDIQKITEESIVAR